MEFKPSLNTLPLTGKKKAECLTAKAGAVSAPEKVFILSSEPNRNPSAPGGQGTAKVVQVMLQPEQLIAVEAWRAANMKTSIEVAIAELVNRALMDEIADTASLLEDVRAHLNAKDHNGSSN
ncbi:MAG: hypothetical protein AAFW74_04105 [Pseudomonadota bacterium]